MRKQIRNLRIAVVSLLCVNLFFILSSFYKDRGAGHGQADGAGNPVVHFEIGCKDLAKTTGFYTGLFGWTPTPAGLASYIDTRSKAGIQGHITALGHEPFNYVTVYIQVDDIASTLTKIVAQGGQKIVGPFPLPTGQKFALFRDPEGNMLGLLTKAAQ